MRLGGQFLAGLAEEHFVPAQEAIDVPNTHHLQLAAAFGGGEIGETSQKIYDAITGIQLGAAEDPFGWRVEVK